MTRKFLGRIWNREVIINELEAKRSLKDDVEA